MSGTSHDIGLSFDERLGSGVALNELVFQAERLLAVFYWKQSLPEDFPVIACLVGGTGTGKSTIFNSLAGKSASTVGRRRPCTREAVALVREDYVKTLLECPVLCAGDSQEIPSSCAKIIIVPPDDDIRAILADTPDFDSVELRNRAVSEGLFHMADVVIFVTSQEKYGDMSGLRVREHAAQWGKAVIAIMNKVGSDHAFEDFQAALKEQDLRLKGLIRIERIDDPPDHIEGLRDRPEFAELDRLLAGDDERDVRKSELEKLRAQTALKLEELCDAADTQIDRVRSVNEKIESILGEVEEELNQKLDAVVSDDVKTHINQRLRYTLKKYDFFFDVRNTIRSAILKTVDGLKSLITLSMGGSSLSEKEKLQRKEAAESLRSAVRLLPLEAAIARFNKEVSELLASHSAYEDLKAIARDDVPVWADEDVRARFEEAFPGMEELLETELNRFRQGLSRGDEVKLYGSFTLSAVVVVVAEIVLGGGFTLFDAMFNTALFPFIPQLILRAKIFDLIRSIANHINSEYRRAQHDILHTRADFYYKTFSSLAPSRSDSARVRETQRRLSS